MPGPPPKPAEQKRKLGNPGKRALRPAAKVVALPAADDDCPADLGKAGRDFWLYATTTTRSWLAPSDRPILEMLCQAFDRREYILQVLSQEGWSVTTDKGYPYKHPLVGTLSDLEKQMTAWMSLLGLSPADRTRLGLAEVKARSKFEELEAKRTKRST